MDKENEELYMEEETPEAEETIEEQEEEEVIDEPHDDSIVLSRVEYNKLKRRAIAYKKSPPQKAPQEQVDSVDLIKLGKKLQDYSNEELDFVTEFAKSKNPNDILKAIENPFVQQGISAYRGKLEQERLAVKPSNTQPEEGLPMSLAEKLNSARTLKEKQEILEEAGLYSEPANNPNRVIIRS